VSRSVEPLATTPTGATRAGRRPTTRRLGVLAIAVRLPVIAPPALGRGLAGHPAPHGIDSCLDRLGLVHPDDVPDGLA